MPIGRGYQDRRRRAIGPRLLLQRRDGRRRKRSLTTEKDGGLRAQGRRRRPASGEQGSEAGSGGRCEEAVRLPLPPQGYDIRTVQELLDNGLHPVLNRGRSPVSLLLSERLHDHGGEFPRSSSSRLPRDSLPGQ